MAKYISPVNILLISIIVYYIYNYYKSNIAPLLNLSPIHSELAKDRCMLVKGPTGCEDIVIPRGESFGILACGADVLYKKIWGKTEYRNLAKNPIKQDILDKFYHFDLETNELIDIPIKNLPKGHTLDVHGFDIIADPKKKNNFLLYSINHMRNSSEVVDKFYYDSAKKELKWFGTEHGEPNFLVNPNGLAFVDPDNYIVANHFKYKSELLHNLQFAGLIKGGAVTHFGPSKTSTIADSIPFANGVVPSKDGKLLFVASTLGLYINVYKIIKHDDGNLEFSYLDKFNVDVLPDNLNLDSETGDIFVAGVIRPFESLAYLSSPDIPGNDLNVAFRVVRIKIEKNSESKDKYNFKTETVLEHDGTVHRLATVAAPHTKLNRVLIGFLYTDGILNCILDHKN